jgi:hypothetical protein
MSSFWPDGLEISDTQSPKDILNTANEEWQKNSDGILELVLQDAESESGNSMIIVHAKHVVNDRTATLFSIIHQPEKPYPVTIKPEKEESLPEFLRKSYDTINVHGSLNTRQAKTIQESVQALTSLPFLRVVNKWVADTPSEFREKLSEAFNLGIIKREILNLASSTGISVNINNSSVNNANEDLEDENL